LRPPGIDAGTDIAKTIEAFDRVFVSYADMPRVTVWRSIGTHVFFEFGMPTLRAVRRKKPGSRALLCGEISLHVSAYNWRMVHGAQPMMNAESVDDTQVDQVAKRFLHGVRPPKFRLDQDGALAMVFERDIQLKIWPNLPEDDEEELSVALRDGWWGFNFQRGFYFAEPRDPA
jgi:hypothetical protein